MSLEREVLERGSGEPSGNDVIGTRVGSDGVSTRLPDAGGEVVALSVRYAIPVHDELMTKSWVSVDDLISASKHGRLPLRSARPLRELSDRLRIMLGISRKKALLLSPIENKVESSHPLSLPAFRLLLNATTYHSRSWSSGRLSASQLKLSA